MRPKYKDQVADVLKGQLFSVADQNYLSRDEQLASVDEALERQLLSIRLALKAGNQLPFDQILDDSKTSNLFLKGEIQFVKAMYFAQNQEHEKTAECYLQAASYFQKSGAGEKWALSQFNHFIAKTYFCKLSLQEENIFLNSIITYCKLHQFDFVHFLCDRHLSFRMSQEKKFHEAAEIILPWLEYDKIKVASDRQLAILHLVDCYLELYDLRKAIAWFDQIPEVVDERVRFPKAFIEAKLFQKNLNINQFPVISSHWRQRYESTKLVSDIKSFVVRKTDLIWDVKNGLMTQNRRLKGRVKIQSLEGQLLRLLINSPRSKEFLCESLWPLEMETSYLADRFHQMIQRINRKNQNLVVFDGQFYRLTSEIKMI